MLLFDMHADFFSEIVLQRTTPPWLGPQANRSCPSRRTGGSPTYGAWPPKGGPRWHPLYWGGGRFVVSLLVNLLVIIEYSGIDWLVN